MNKLSLKFFGIFIILIFCLSPLAAMDLNQDDNNKYINQSMDMSNIGFEDADDSIVNDDNDVQCVDKDNETINADASIVSDDED